MSLNSDHPGVTLEQLQLGAKYKLHFRFQGRKTCRGSGTNNLEIARGYARKISEILRGNLFGNPPAGTPSEVLKMLGIKRKINVIDDGVNAGFQSFLESREWGTGFPDEPMNEYVRRLIDGFNAAQANAKMLESRVSELEQQHASDKIRTDELTERCKAYEAHHVNEGRKLAKKFEKRTLREAINNYLANRTESADRYKDTIGGYLDAFAKAIDKKAKRPDLEALKPNTESMNSVEKVIALKAAAAAKLAARQKYTSLAGTHIDISDIKPTKVLDYFNELSKHLAASTLNQHAVYICAMLQDQSGGLFDLSDIKAWISEKIRKKKKGEDDYFWLETGQTEGLIAALKKQDFGDYWSDAALIQHHLGLRPEEIVMLQTHYVNRDQSGNVASIYIGPIKEGGVLIRDVKTHDAAATLWVESETCRNALERRLKNNQRFLFPRDEKQCGVRPQRLSGRTRQKIEARKLKDADFKAKIEFELRHGIWTPKTWDRLYLERMRAAAMQVEGINFEMLDSRTLRRTRGRDVIVATGSAEMAAALLRDNVTTVRKHYARLLPKDVKVV